MLCCSAHDNHNDRKQKLISFYYWFHIVQYLVKTTAGCHLPSFVTPRSRAWWFSLRRMRPIAPNTIKIAAVKSRSFYGLRRITLKKVGTFRFEEMAETCSPEPYTYSWTSREAILDLDLVLRHQVYGSLCMTVIRRSWCPVRFLVPTVSVLDQLVLRGPLTHCFCL